MKMQNELPKTKEKIKENIDSERLKMVLRSWLSALESSQDLEIAIGGARRTLPASALSGGRAQLEWELRPDGSYELEIELKGSVTRKEQAA